MICTKVRILYQITAPCRSAESRETIVFAALFYILLVKIASRNTSNDVFAI